MRLKGLFSRATELVRLMATHRCSKGETMVVAGSVAFLMEKRKRGGSELGCDEDFVAWPLPREFT